MLVVVFLSCFTERKTFVDPLDLHCWGDQQCCVCYLLIHCLFFGGDPVDYRFTIGPRERMYISEYRVHWVVCTYLSYSIHQLPPSLSPLELL